MISARKQSMLNDAVASATDLMTRKGLREPVFLTLDHLSGENLSDEQKQSLFDAFTSSIYRDNTAPFAEDEASHLIAEQLRGLGAVTYSFTDASRWSDGECMTTCGIKAVTESGLPVVTAQLIEKLDKYSDELCELMIAEQLMANRTILYENESLQFNVLVCLDIIAGDDSTLVVVDEQTRILKGVRVSVLAGEKEEALYCGWDIGQGDHDRYDITFVFGQPPSFTRLFVPSS
jgi:hypothetical protein